MPKSDFRKSSSSGVGTLEKNRIDRLANKWIGIGSVDQQKFESNRQTRKQIRLGSGQQTSKKLDQFGRLAKKLDRDRVSRLAKIWIGSVDSQKIGSVDYQKVGSFFMKSPFFENFRIFFLIFEKFWRKCTLPFFRTIVDSQC